MIKGPEVHNYSSDSELGESKCELCAILGTTLQELDTTPDVAICRQHENSACDATSGNVLWR